MTQEEKQLLLKDICGRQFYGTKILGPWEKDGPCELSAIDLTSSRQIRVFEDWFKIEEVKPYLRSMSSMTEDEEDELNSARMGNYGEDADWLNAHYFDYHIVPSTGKTLIESGLALEAKEGMYKIKETW